MLSCFFSHPKSKGCSLFSPLFTANFHCILQYLNDHCTCCSNFLILCRLTSDCCLLKISLSNQMLHLHRGALMSIPCISLFMSMRHFSIPLPFLSHLKQTLTHGEHVFVIYYIRQHSCIRITYLTSCAIFVKIYHFYNS